MKKECNRKYLKKESQVNKNNDSFYNLDKHAVKGAFRIF